MGIWWLIGGILGFGLGAIMGAPYLPILRRDQETVLDLLALKPGQSLADLGSGDGRLLIAAARRQIRSIGYEINPVLFLISKITTWPYRELITIKLANFWTATIPKTDAIFVFLIERYMSKLDAKLQAEITEPTKLVSFVFEVPNRASVRSTKNAWVYQYPFRNKS